MLRDFRRADCAAGGHGAPLVPYVDALLFGSTEATTVALNLGGIANVTADSAGAGSDGCAAGTRGPANMLLDAFVRERTAGAERSMRRRARVARDGVEAHRSKRCSRDPYFAQAPPKSTGRERFGAAFLERLHLLRTLSLEDGCATLVALSAETIARDLRAAVPGGARTIAAGGGVRNAALMDAISRDASATRSLRQIRPPRHRPGCEGGDRLRAARLRNAARPARGLPARDRRAHPRGARRDRAARLEELMRARACRNRADESGS